MFGMLFAYTLISFHSAVYWFKKRPLVLRGALFIIIFINMYITFFQIAALHLLISFGSFRVHLR